MKNGVNISFDGAWSHVKNSFQHTAVFIESFSQKIVAFSVLYKDYREFPGNYEVTKAGNLMEIESLRLMRNELLDQRIKSFTSDGDIKIHKLIEGIPRSPKLLITKDLGHIYFSIMWTLRTLRSRNQNIFEPLINNFSKFKL